MGGQDELVLKIPATEMPGETRKTKVPNKKSEAAEAEPSAKGAKDGVEPATTAAARGQSHSRESSGASNLSVKFTITQGQDGSPPIATASVKTNDHDCERFSSSPEDDPDPSAPLVSVEVSTAAAAPATSVEGPGANPAAAPTFKNGGTFVTSAAAAALAGSKGYVAGLIGRSMVRRGCDIGSAASTSISIHADANAGSSGGHVNDIGFSHDSALDPRMLGGDPKSPNNDYGSFSNTPSDKFVSSIVGAGRRDVAGGGQGPADPGAVGGGAPPTGGVRKSKQLFRTSDSVLITAADSDPPVPPSSSSGVMTHKRNESYSRRPLLENCSPSDSSCSEDDAGANSSGYIRRKTRHHNKDSLSRSVRIDIEQGASEGDGAAALAAAAEEECRPIPSEVLKTLVAFVFFFLSWLATITSLALTHDRVPDVPPLPDIFLDNVTYQPWGLDASEIIILVSVWTTFILVIFHKHRFIVLRRIFLLVGLHYYYRSITMFITVLPKSNTNYKCAPQLNHTDALIIAQRVLKLFSGMGLSINGQHIYCGDYIYSGHTMILIMCYLVIKEYSPKRWFLFHYASLALSVTGVLMLLLARGHYSIDVVVAYWITTRVWWIFHTLATSPNLKDGGEANNYLDRMWWWYIFRYFECNVPVYLPREYNLPIPNRLMRYRPFSWLADIGSSSSSSSQQQQQQHPTATPTDEEAAAPSSAVRDKTR